MSFKSDRARFKTYRTDFNRTLPYRRYMQNNYLHGQLTRAIAAGDHALAAELRTALAEPLSASHGPPVAIADTPPAPPASPEEP